MTYESVAPEGTNEYERRKKYILSNILLNALPSVKQMDITVYLLQIHN